MCWCLHTELKSAVTVEAPGANFAADKAITADGHEAELLGSTTVQQPSSDMNSAAGKTGVIATAIVAERACDKPTASKL